MAPTPSDFATIEKAARERHDATTIAARLSTPKDDAALRAVPDDRYLSAMSLRIFRAGLKHELVDRKWPAFEAALAGFDPTRCARLTDEDFDRLLSNPALIRHGPKMLAVRRNAEAMLALADEVGGMGVWLADWPSENVVGLWDALARRFAQLGGNSAPSFLRMVGKDTFILTDSVIKALLYWQAVDEPPTSKTARQRVQERFNAWREESGYPLCQLSQLLAMSCD